jgi:uncharacterized protein DUF1707
MRYVSEEAGEIRASDGERDEIAARLSHAVGRGQLTLAEFSSRVEAAYASRTRGELDKLVTDLAPLPQPASTPAPAQGERPKPNWSVSIVGGTSRKGRFRQAARSIYVTLIGGIDMDMRNAELDAQRVEITHVSIIGGVSLRVPPGVRVEINGFTLIGGKSLRVDETSIHPNAPTIVINGFALIGGIDVKTVGPNEQK